MLLTFLKVLMIIFFLLSTYAIRVAKGKAQRSYNTRPNNVNNWSRGTQLNPQASYGVRNIIRAKAASYKGCERPTYFNSNSDILIEECDSQGGHQACRRHAKIPEGWNLSRICAYKDLNLKIKTSCQSDGSWTSSIAFCPTRTERDELFKKIFAEMIAKEKPTVPVPDDIFKSFPCIPLRITQAENTDISCRLPGDQFETKDCLKMKQVPSGTYFFMRCKSPYYGKNDFPTVWHCLDGHWKGDSTKLLCYHDYYPTLAPPKAPINTLPDIPETYPTDNQEEPLPFVPEKYFNIRKLSDNRRRPESKTSYENTEDSSNENDDDFSPIDIRAQQFRKPTTSSKPSNKKNSQRPRRPLPKRPPPQPQKAPEYEEPIPPQYHEENSNHDSHSNGFTENLSHTENGNDSNRDSNPSYSNPNTDYESTGDVYDVRSRKCSPLFNDSPGRKLECVYRDQGWNSVVLTECQEPSESGTEARYTCKQFYQSVSESGLSTVYRTCVDGTWMGDSELACRLQCGMVMSVKTPFIVNGIPAKRGQWPWHSAIFFKEHETFEYTCGGTLISLNPPTILTAAHCITIHETSTLKDVTRFRIDLGKFLLNDSNQYVQSSGVKEIYVHESFNPLNYDSDIGLIVLEKPVKVSQFVRPICFQQSSDSALEEIQLSERSVGTVVGWGFDKSRTLTNDLRMTNLQVIGPRECLEANKDSASGLQSRSTTYCAGSHNNSNVCNGDSGGGMYFKSSNLESTTWYLQGIVSVGISENGRCKPDSFSIFTRVGRYAEWLVRILSKINYDN